DGDALADVRGVHVSAEVAGPQAAPRLLARGRDRHASQHGPQRDLDAPAGRTGQLEDADVPLAVEAPLVPPRGQRVVEHPRARVAGDGADAARVDGRDRVVAVQPQLQDLHDERVAGARALDMERAHLAGPASAGLRVVVAGTREGLGL